MRVTQQESTEDADAGEEEDFFPAFGKEGMDFIEPPHQIQSWDHRDWMDKHQQPPACLCVCPWVTKSVPPDVAVTFLPIQMWRRSRLQPLINLVMMNMSQLRTLPWQNTQEGKQTPGMSSKMCWRKGSGLTARRELSNVAAFTQQLPTVQTVKRDDQLWRRKTRLTFPQHGVKNRQQLCSYEEVGKYFSFNFHWNPVWTLFTLPTMRWRTSIIRS